MKALKGQTWGANPETILYSYRTYVRPLLEYSCILFANASEQLFKKIQAVETTAIKIAYRLTPWATNTYCYSLVNFETILNRTKSLSKQFLKKNKDDELMKPCLLYTSPSPRDLSTSRMPSSA